MNESSEVLRSIQEVPMLYKRLFCKELDFYDMLELSPIVLQATGGIAIKTYLFKGSIKDFRLDLPCNVYAIEHVCSSKPITWYTNFLNQNNVIINYRVDESRNLGLYNPAATNFNSLGDETGVVYEINKNVFSKPLGVMLNHTNEKNACLTFNIKLLDVDVLYTGAVVDAEGYPMLREKTLEALAQFMNYVDVRIKYNMRIADGNMLALAQHEKDLAIAQARTPSSLSQNEMDMILNALSSSNRKHFNRQYRQ